MMHIKGIQGCMRVQPITQERRSKGRNEAQKTGKKVKLTQQKGLNIKH